MYGDTKASTRGSLYLETYLSSLLLNLEAHIWCLPSVSWVMKHLLGEWTTTLESTCYRLKSACQLPMPGMYTGGEIMYVATVVFSKLILIGWHSSWIGLYCRHNGNAQNPGCWSEDETSQATTSPVTGYPGLHSPTSIMRSFKRPEGRISLILEKVGGEKQWRGKYQSVALEYFPCIYGSEMQAFKVSAIVNKCSPHQY